MDLQACQQQFASSDRSERMKAITESRVLPLADRFDLLCAAVNDPDPRIRYDAVSQLGTAGIIDVTIVRTILENCLQNDPEIDVKAAAADSLGALQLTASFPLLVSTYHSTTDWLLQLSILAALGSLGEKAAYDLLVSALNHENELIKISAIRSLGDLGDDRALAIMETFVHHPDWQVRHAVVQSLGCFGPSGKTLLSTLAHDGVEQVAATARMFLAE